MKFLYNSAEHKLINLANVVEIYVSENYLMLSLIDGREMRFLYGATDILNKLHTKIMLFIETEDMRVFDCYEFINNL